MFTGIIEDVGRIVRTVERADGRLLQIAATFSDTLVKGQSVCVNGACLTVTGIHPNAFGVTAVGETLRKTTLGLLRPDSLVNLERAMLASARFEGHIVQGHVDGTCRISAVLHEDHDRLYTFNTPPDLQPYLIPQGSVTLDGISLTIARKAASFFAVAIIPTTHAHTTARYWRKGAPVNIECDVIGKYVANYLSATRT